MSDERQLFQDVVMPHLDEAMSLARWLTGNRSDAEDVVQDACLRAYGAIQSARGANPRAWLLAIVRNTAFTWMGKNRPKGVIVTDDDNLIEQASLEMVDASASTPETALISMVESEDLHRAIAGLPAAYREVLVLREIEELSYQEIAKTLAIPIGTVMSRLARARSQLVQRVGQTERERRVRP